MGWEGTEVTPQIRTLIEDHHLGAILLTTKNLKSKSLDSFSACTCLLLPCPFCCLVVAVGRRDYIVPLEPAWDFDVFFDPYTLRAVYLYTVYSTYAYKY